MTGRVVYQPSTASVPASATATAAQAFVAGWLENTDGSDTLAFEPSATVMHMTIDADVSSTAHLSPTQLPQYPAIKNRLAGVVERPLEVDVTQLVVRLVLAS